ncbi:hypothetical protein HDU85_001424 [Gaertneriomyces sp. JEL0708]|nr:hypothetical protein HDU85_001424 [Gaertneriomyces sp. JEL0708]
MRANSNGAQLVELFGEAFAVGTSGALAAASGALLASPDLVRGYSSSAQLLGTASYGFQHDNNEDLLNIFFDMGDTDSDRVYTLPNSLNKSHASAPSLGLDYTARKCSSGVGRPRYPSSSVDPNLGLIDEVFAFNINGQANPTQNDSRIHEAHKDAGLMVDMHHHEPVDLVTGDFLNDSLLGAETGDGSADASSFRGDAHFNYFNSGSPAVPSEDAMHLSVESTPPAAPIASPSTDMARKRAGEKPQVIRTQNLHLTPHSPRDSAISLSSQLSSLSPTDSTGHILLPVYPMSFVPGLPGVPDTSFMPEGVHFMHHPVPISSQQQPQQLPPRWVRPPASSPHNGGIRSAPYPVNPFFSRNRTRSVPVIHTNWAHPGQPTDSQQILTTTTAVYPASPEASLSPSMPVTPMSLEGRGQGDASRYGPPNKSTLSGSMPALNTQSGVDGPPSASRVGPMSRSGRRKSSTPATGSFNNVMTAGSRLVKRMSISSSMARLSLKSVTLDDINRQQEAMLAHIAEAQAMRSKEEEESSQMLHTLNKLLGLQQQG